ncbi:hypothetical protein ABBQ32_009788 [Trebouxia sp. C0010 RCD-2024]
MIPTPSSCGFRQSCEHLSKAAVRVYVRKKIQQQLGLAQSSYLGCQPGYAAHKRYRPCVATRENRKPTLHHLPLPVPHAELVTEPDEEPLEGFAGLQIDKWCFTSVRSLKTSCSSNVGCSARSSFYCFPDVHRHHYLPLGWRKSSENTCLLLRADIGCFVLHCTCTVFDVVAMFKLFSCNSIT